MKLSKIVLLPLVALTLASCGDGDVDPKLYHLTLSSNLSSVSQDSLKATFAYGVEGKTVTEGVRDSDEIEELKKAGATDADIEKAGKRQDDGSYYFFDGDPMYLESPNSFGGYKYKGWFDKGANTYIYNQYMTGNDGNIPRWNMENKDMNLEARYEKWTYHYYFNNMEDGETNPNVEGDYCALNDGVVTLQPATTTNTKKKFIGWEYQDRQNLDDQGQAKWVLIEDGILPIEYYEEDMRISARWEIIPVQISFNFKVNIEPEVFEPVTYEDAIDSMSAKGNATTIDGVKIPCEQESRTPINKNSVVKMETGSWLEVFFTLKSNYEVWYFELNGVRNPLLGSKESEYIDISSDVKITDDSIITFVLSNKIPG